MSNQTYYAGIDTFRLIAALLVVAIHTSPLGDFWATGDFVLTRVIARTAVPFFFMTSGFFIISRYSRDAQRLCSFVKKSLLIYGAAILLYIPVNVYNGYFEVPNLLPKIIKDLVFDGTIYHLWYLPASVIGAAFAWYLVRRFGGKAALAIAGVLYLIGLFGDSYYGISEAVSGMSAFYKQVFQVCDYTRNGVFFAPVFFVLGGLIADSRRRISLPASICGFTVSLVLMLGEAMVLHAFHLQRHDSMYVFLLPCMYFLFQTVLHFRGTRHTWLRPLSLIVYVLHPLVIVMVRLYGKLFPAQYLIVEDSLLFYITVCAATMVLGLLLIFLWSRYRPGTRKHLAGTDRAYVELDLDHLEHNVRVLQEAMPAKSELMAVVKAEAYGHGAFEVAVRLNQMGVEAFAVATIDEGIRLRTYGIRGEILILGYTSPERVKALKQYDLIQTLIDLEYAEALNRRGVVIKTHLKIDTGMHRLGIPSEAVSRVEKIFSLKSLRVCGMFTHLCCADSLQPEDVSFTEGQIERFYSLVDALRTRGIAIPKLHIQSSYGLLNYPDLNCDYVRAGIALYGVLSAPGDQTGLNLDLRPVLSLKSSVVLIRSVRKGESIGYSRCFTAERDSRIAILPIGYGDGVPRALSCGSGSVIIHQQQAPVVGRICMDQLAVDITDVRGVAVGDPATLIGSEDSDGLPAPVVADCAGSISNELLCRMGARLPVVVKRRQ